MTSLVQDGVALWWSWMVTASVQCAVLVPVLAVLDRSLRRWLPRRMRSAMWWAVFLKLVVPSWFNLTISIPGMDSDVSNLVALRAGSEWGMIHAAFVVWLSGLLLLAGMGFLNHVRLRREWALAVDPPEELLARVLQLGKKVGLTSRPPIRVVEACSSPAVVGLWRPLIVLPAKMLSAGTAREIDHALLHELVHVRRKDPWLGLIRLGVQLLFWFHPLVWLVGRRLSTLTELACDEQAARAGDPAGGPYRDSLVRLAQLLLPRSGPFGLALIPRKSQFIIRLERLERPFERTSMSRRVLTVILFCGLLALGGQGPKTETTGGWNPTIGEIPPGCLQLRYTVQRMLALEEQRGAALANRSRTVEPKERLE